MQSNNGIGGPKDAAGKPVPFCALMEGRSLAWLNRAHDEQLSLCRELEEIADSLPGSIDRQKCIYAAKALGPLIRGIHHYEENVLFPWLEGRIAKSQPLADTLSRLKFEHCEDECFAEELTDALLKLGSGEPVNMEAVGYMLRGFFEGMRRHIAFEREHLLKEIPEDTVVTGHN
ncbi:hemerythrin domain-containing protein [Rhizobium sp. CG5]|uniref:hemerythrin domain-containing protein n=1 Tax=Rhizobium sp. CG5 TaxID=2726076 RepID=UPI0020335E3C|nr:hemerythrin domain-containing protein [Rhizobium sp. CG5]MCM2474891.1 hemerythrin domain-containing protein [Rhizobium sp. CG5]